MDVTIREAVNSDAENIKKLVFGILIDYGLKHDPETTDADLENIEATYFDRGGAFYIFENSDGLIIGSTGIYPMEEDECELRKMYLDSSFRGQGLGKKLLEMSLDKARELGFRRVTLETASVLKEALQLYQHYGFKEFKPSHLSSRCDQAFYLDLE